MNVYRIRTDSNVCRRLDFDQRKIDEYDLVEWSEQNDCRGQPLPDWCPPPMHWGNPLAPDPDFLDCPAPGSFAVHPRSIDTVGMFMEMAGELLPIPYKGISFQVLNILRVWDCIDEDQSEWLKRPDGSRICLLKPYFVPQHFEASPLFKIPELPRWIYCWEHNREPEEEFKACVEANKLTGLKFELVWSDETLRKRAG